MYIAIYRLKPTESDKSLQITKGALKYFEYAVLLHFLSYFLMLTLLEGDHEE